MTELRAWLKDEQHPLGSPLLGRIVSSLACRLGHDIVIMDREQWDEEWIACRRCGARWFPADAIDEDTDIIRV